MTYQYKPMTGELLTEFLRNIRDEDLQEVQAGGGSFAELTEVLTGLLAYQQVPDVFIALLASTGDVLAVGGIVPTEGTKHGAPWFLCTKKVSQFPKELLKGLREKSDLWETQFDTQLHQLWAVNRLHVKLVRSLGYTIHPEVDAQGFAIFSKGCT